MTSIESLPLLQVRQGVGLDEDFILVLAFYLADGTTPLSLAGITFSATLSQPGSNQTLSTTGGQIAIGAGGASNVLTFTVFAAAKAAWKRGVYEFALTAADGVYTKDLFVDSTLTLSEPSPPMVSTIGPGGPTVNNVVVPLPPQFAQVLTPPINTQLGTTYTLQPSDNGATVYFVNAAPITLTVPAGLSAGFECGFVQGGAGQVTPTASSATIHNRQGFTKTAGQYAYMALVAVAADLFILVGDGA